jgi:hypothetical protein
LSSGGDYLRFNVPNFDSTFQHYTISINGTTGSIYDNDSAANVTTTDATATALASGTEPFLFGRRGNDQNKSIADLDDVHIYNRVLSLSESNQLYTRTSIPSSNLVASWNFDGTLNDTVNAQNGTVYPLVPSLVTDGPVGPAHYLDQKSYSANAISISGNASRTFCAWMKIPSYVSQASLIRTGVVNSSLQDFSLETSSISGNINVNLWTIPGDFGFAIPSDVNGWHHIAVTFDGQATAYVDGVAKGTSALVSALNTPDTGIKVGISRDGSIGTNPYHQ